MNASIRGQGDEVRFVVEDADAATAALLSAQFYAEADGRFEKRFRRHDLLFPHDFQAIEARWVRYLREARDRRVTPAAVDGALAWVADRHAEAGVDWWLAGSAALYVRGIDLLPHDIDVMSYLREADALAPVVEGSIVEPFHPRARGDHAPAVERGARPARPRGADPRVRAAGRRRSASLRWRPQLDDRSGSAAPQRRQYFASSPCPVSPQSPQILRSAARRRDASRPSPARASSVVTMPVGTAMTA